jgi:hypothetical protein
MKQSNRWIAAALIATVSALGARAASASEKCHTSNAFCHAASDAVGHAAHDVAEGAIIAGAVTGGLALVGLTTWYYLRHRHTDQRTTAVVAAKLAANDVARCGAATGDLGSMCW